ncbi:Inner membrane transport permease YbhR [Paraliobacillus sp. PM-2]|uniref:ABC transporter permease n=1 Tax=Paraliobacillus sp. PM-2 TaxID=1462524 RepID=UPI00061CBAF4|nr:ABC transporter permease [Paraliobacillus sp. PM-2]CQR48313.1 Inner membrane transport permease YbhR [Paraliobacillus sp. PM-2]
MKITAIITRIVQQFIRDKRTLALLFLAPLLILILTWVVLDQEAAGDYAIAAVSVPEPVVEKIEGEHIEMVETSTPYADLADGEVQAVLTLEDQQLQLTVDNSQPNAEKALFMQLQRALSTTNNTNIALEVTDYYQAEVETTFDYVGPVLIGYFAFFFVFLVGGISFLREKSQGTMERLFATPIRSWEIIIGYLAGFGVFAIIQSIVVIAFSVYVLSIPIQGSVLLVMFITLMLALTALTLGMLLSTFAKNEFQMMQFIPIVIVPQAFFSGLFSLDNAPAWVEGIGRIMPIKYGASALTDVMIKGNGFGEVSLDLLILFGFSSLFFILNLGTLIAYRK